MSPPFAGPQPFRVHWTDNGRGRAATTNSRATADRIFDDLVVARQHPTIWLGGGIIRDDAKPMEMWEVPVE